MKETVKFKSEREESKVCFKQLLLHVPHSSVTFPDDSGHSFCELDSDVTPKVFCLTFGVHFK